MNKKSKTRTVQFRRKREGKTNYKKRLKILKSGMPRLVIRRSLNHVSVQIVNYSPEGDKVVVTVTSKALEKMGWPVKGNVPSAYLTGLLIGKKAADLKIKHVVLDLGMHMSIKGSRIYALVKGAIDAGMDIPCGSDIFPSEERITGKDIAAFAKMLKEKDADAYKKQFSKYLKDNNDPMMIEKLFENIKNKIIGVN